MNVTVAAEICQVAVSAGLAIDSLERLARLDDYGYDGLLSPDVFADGAPGLSRTTQWLRRTMCARKAVRDVVGFRLLLLAAALFPGMPYRIRAGLLILVALANVLIGARSAYGCDGSDHMDEVIVVGLAAAFLFAPDRLAWLGIVFICAQSLLSYAASGIAKLVSPMWRRGMAVPAILGTTSYGTDRARFVLASVPGLGRVLSVGTIVLECAVPLVLLLPTPMMTAILLAAAAMHIAIAVVMGLNKFLLSWLATYPAIVACHGVVAHAVR